MNEIEIHKECNHIHLLSGGLDSAYNLLRVAKYFKEKDEKVVIQPIFFDYGQFAAKEEWKRVPKIVEYIRNFLDDNSIISDPVKICLASELFQWCRNDAFLGNKGIPNAEIENRNMVLFSVLASYLIACAKHKGIGTSCKETSESERTQFIITSGFKQKEMQDSKKEFFSGIESLLNCYNDKLDFHFEILPYKRRYAIEGLTKKLLNGSEEELNKFMRLTISCYSPTDTGEKCGMCSKCTSIKKELD